MAFNFKRAAIGFGTGGLSELYRAGQRNFGRGGGGSADPRLFMESGAGNTFDPARVVDVYRQAVGREPNQNELDQFKKFIEDGDLQYQDLAEILGASPEMQQRILESQTTDLGNRLGASDDTILNRSMSALESRYRQLGRPQTTGFDSSFARSAQDLALSRQDALNSFYSNGLTGVRGSYLARGESARERGFGLADSRTDYNRGINMAALGQAYNQSQADRDLQIQKRQALGQLAFTALGAGIGGKVGGVKGALAGGQIGSATGGSFGLLGSRGY